MSTKTEKQNKKWLQNKNKT